MALWMVPRSPHATVRGIEAAVAALISPTWRVGVWWDELEKALEARSAREILAWAPGWAKAHGWEARYSPGSFVLFSMRPPVAEG